MWCYWAKQQHAAAANKSPATREQREGPVAPGDMPLGGFVGCCQVATYHSVTFGSHLEHIGFASIPRGFASNISLECTGSVSSVLPRCAWDASP